MRTSIIDTIATIVFFTVFATFSELVIAGMDLSSVLTTRLVMIPVMIATGRPYTVWRDWLFSQVQPRGYFSAAAADIAAFLVFQVPVYGATLMIAGASASEALFAIGSAIVLMVLLARPFGLFVDLMRRMFGIELAR
ncbi:L-alanine exporter AlaE [Labrenzia sp. 011]|uniref:L-alanine exporter AlaE n=1 Tax=Labrenzia sp. 011 TaxID=2171494 RepID=UPI000D51CD8B|nr:L-alanine exporter AlaE [Labrenzia sp. 011]PVB60805.1 L-alanine exporter AlaE [Labrenzia sp. 011]